MPFTPSLRLVLKPEKLNLSVVMFRNQYDTDITTFSPQGRLHQVEYATEAIKQGSAVIGIRSRTHAVLVSVKRALSDLASHQQKIFMIDTHVGVAISGITADARVLCKFMRSECLQHRFVYERAMPVGRLVRRVSDRCQACTQRASKRPFGVGLLIVGVDDLGPHVFQTLPSGEEYELNAMAMGARSQSAKTYLERNVGSFMDASRDELIRHALKALRETLSSTRDAQLTPENCTMALVGVGEDETFRVFQDEEMTLLLLSIEPDSVTSDDPDSHTAPEAPAEERMEDTP